MKLPSMIDLASVMNYDHYTLSSSTIKKQGALSRTTPYSDWDIKNPEGSRSGARHGFENIALLSRVQYSL